MNTFKKIGLGILGAIVAILYFFLGRRETTSNSTTISDQNLTNSANEISNEIKEKEDKINEINTNIDNIDVKENWHERG